MRIVVDLQSAQSGSRFGGIGRYSLELLKGMVRVNRSHDFWVLLSDLLPTPAQEVRVALADLVPQDRILSFCAPPGIAELTANTTKVRMAEVVREQFLAELDPDVVHVTSLFEGLQEEVITSVGQVFPAQRTAVTLYDLIPYVERDKYLQSKAALRHYLGKVGHLKRAGLLLSISEFSRREAIDLLGLPPERIVNISSAADRRFRVMAVKAEVAEHARKKYGITTPKFIMYTGSFDQRKNHEKLLEAYALLPVKLRRGRQLVMAGNGWEGIYLRLRRGAQGYGLGDDEVVFTGHIADTDLPVLYNLCDVFVFPSLAEGFGLPVLEAMSCGAPTVCSNCTSLPEVIGWPEAQFDPTDAGSIAKVLRRALGDSRYRRELRERGIERAKAFSWEASGRRALEGLESLGADARKAGNLAGAKSDSDSASQTREFSPLERAVERIASLESVATMPDGFLEEISSCMSVNRNQAESLRAISNGEVSTLRIGWVTTWGTRCGVASYSRYLVDHLPGQVAIFAEQTPWTTAKDESFVKRCWQPGEPDDLRRLMGAIRQAEIDVLMIQFNYSFFHFEHLTNLLKVALDEGIRLFVTLHSTDDPAPEKKLERLAEMLTKCQGVVVHSPHDVERLAGLGVKSNVVFVPQGCVGSHADARYDKRSGLEVAIATYGFALPHKGLMQMVEAVSILRQSRGIGIRLLMLNAEYPNSQSQETIAQIEFTIRAKGLDENVTFISEYLPEEKCFEYLRSADLIVFPYQKTGESSSAAVRMGLAAGRPVAVTPLNIFDDVSAVTFQLPGISAADIAEGIDLVLKQITERDEGAERVLENAKLWRNAHGHESVARYLYWLFAKPEVLRGQYEIERGFDLTCLSEPLNLAASDTALKTSIGEKGAERIRCTGRSGSLMYGPYISVGPGAYRATVEGEIGSGGACGARADIAVEGGARVLAEAVIDAESSRMGNGTASLAAICFDVPAPGCCDLEVRVHVNERSDISISRVEVSPLADP